MADEEIPPTPEQIAEIRNRTNDYITENGKSVFDPRDVNALMTNDHLVTRFFCHVQEVGGDQVTNAYNMVINSFQWRLKKAVADIKEADLSPSIRDKGVIYLHNVDKEGKKLLVFEVKKHQKGKESMEDLKTYFLYMIERTERETNGDKITLVFDCAGCGLKNLDMELMQFMIGTFKDYVPLKLNYILVFEMPWVLNAAWKVIKSWLPAGAAKLIKFVNKGNMAEYVDNDQRFVAWGGDDDWEYEYEPEKVATPDPQPNSAKDITSVDEKKVTFARNNNQSSSPVEAIKPLPSSRDSVASSISRAASFSSSMSENSINLLSLAPADEVVFLEISPGDYVGKVKVQNIHQGSIAIKIKTTSPDKFRVRPSNAALPPGGSAIIEIYMQSDNSAAAGVTKDKFLISALMVEGDGVMNSGQITEAFKISRPDAQYRLRCTLAGANENIPAVAVTPRMAGNSTTRQPASQPPPTSRASKPPADPVDKKLTSLMKQNEELLQEIGLVKKLLLAVIVLLTILTIGMFWPTTAPASSSLIDSTDPMIKNNHPDVAEL